MTFLFFFGFCHFFLAGLYTFVFVFVFVFGFGFVGFFLSIMFAILLIGHFTVSPHVMNWG